MNVKFEIRTTDNTFAYSELSGCVEKAELQNEADLSLDLDRGSWISRMKELLPGERFEPYRNEAKECWSQVQKIVQAASELRLTTTARADFYDYSRRQSLAYQQLLEKGMNSPDGERLMREIEHMKMKCHQAAHVISSSVLGSLFDKGMYHIT